MPFFDDLRELLGREEYETSGSAFGGTRPRTNKGELADRAELHRRYIGDIEPCAGNLPLENIEKIATALEVSISALFADYGIEEEK